MIAGIAGFLLSIVFILILIGVVIGLAVSGRRRR